MEYVSKIDAFVSVCELPGRVKGLLTVDADGNNYILINESLTESEQAKTLNHEILHIVRNDLYSDKPAHVIEQEMNE